MDDLVKRYKLLYGVELRAIPVLWEKDRYIVNMIYPDGVVYADVLYENEIKDKTLKDIDKWLSINFKGHRSK